MIATTPDGIIIDVRVIPRAAKPGIAGTRDGALLVRLNAPPVEGAANAELIEVLGKALAVPTRSVEIVAGAQAWVSEETEELNRSNRATEIHNGFRSPFLCFSCLMTLFPPRSPCLPPRAARIASCSQPRTSSSSAPR
jgi:uncharacterized protein (TIGR00251 family)